jgi:uncharacterized protein
MASCPICNKALASSAPSASASNGQQPSTYPFCSPRCKLVDLGNWLGGRYVIAGPAASPNESGEAGEPDEQELMALLRDLQ